MEPVPQQRDEECQVWFVAEIQVGLAVLVRGMNRTLGLGTWISDGDRTIRSVNLI